MLTLWAYFFGAIFSPEFTESSFFAGDSAKNMSRKRLAQGASCLVEILQMSQTFRSEPLQKTCSFLWRTSGLSVFMFSKLQQPMKTKKKQSGFYHRNKQERKLLFVFFAFLHWCKLHIINISYHFSGGAPQRNGGSVMKSHMRDTPHFLPVLENMAVTHGISGNCIFLKP